MEIHKNARLVAQSSESHPIRRSAVNHRTAPCLSLRREQRLEKPQVPSHPWMCQRWRLLDTECEMLHKQGLLEVYEILFNRGRFGARFRSQPLGQTPRI